MKVLGTLRPLTLPWAFLREDLSPVPVRAPSPELSQPMVHNAGVSQAAGSRPHAVTAGTGHKVSKVCNTATQGHLEKQGAPPNSQVLPWEQASGAAPLLLCAELPAPAEQGGREPEEMGRSSFSSSTCPSTQRLPPSEGGGNTQPK